MRYFWLFLLFFSKIFGQDITGFWKTINEETNKAESVVAIYKYDGKYYGRLIATYQPDGTIEDTMYYPVERAPGIVNNPPYNGLDFIYHLKPDGAHYEGKIVDPEEGKVYNAELWVSKGNLIVRGKLFIFGRNQTWPPFPENQFTDTFPKPDVSKFVPVIPKTIN